MVIGVLKFSCVDVWTSINLRTSTLPEHIKSMELLIEILGWIGSFEVLLAYGLNAANRLKSNSLTYILLNLTGGILLIIYTFYLKAYPNTFINVVWVVVAVGAMVQFIRKR
jgi:hypothetical protein